MLYKNKNYIFKQPVVEDGDEFLCCNFLQKFPHTEILSGKTGLTFRRCNLTNCDYPEDSTIDMCLARHVEFCANLHPDFGLDPEDANCPHVASYDDIIIDGQLIQRIYTYQDKDIK